MSQTLDNPPYKTPLTDADGYLSQAWMAWIRILFKRVGSNEALSNTELETVRTDDIEALQLEVDALETTVSTLSTLADGLNQGQQI